MQTHQAITTKGNEAQCSNCENWIGPADSCVILQPAMVQDGGDVQRTALAYHGVLCMGCFNDL